MRSWRCFPATLLRAAHAPRPWASPCLCARDAVEFEGLTVGAGIATGSVIQGMIGSIRRADFTVIGDSVNLASRLCGMAKGMQIVVSDTTMREAESEFRFVGPFSVSVKGKSESQRVWLLSGRGGRRRDDLKVQRPSRAANSRS